MAVLIGHRSALAYWRRNERSPLKEVCCPSRADIHPQGSDIEAAREALGLHPCEPLHIIAADKAQRTHLSGSTCHVWTPPQPMRAVRIAEEVFLSTPEACFLQLAYAEDIPYLAQIAMELCGTYRLCEEAEHGFVNARPQTSNVELAQFAQTLEGSRGVKKALKALEVARDNAASPMEANLVILSCLPSVWGGYGLNPPILNARIDLDRTASRLASQQTYYADLYWPEYRLAIEYDSDIFHANSEGIARDSKRRNALAAMGIATISVTRSQVMSVEEFHRTMLVVFKYVGLRARNRGKSFEMQRTLLRNAVLFRGRGGDLWHLRAG